MSSVEEGEENLPDNDLMPIAKKSSPGDIEQIAIRYFDISYDEIRTFKARHRENIEMASFEILECWRDVKNPGKKGNVTFDVVIIKRSSLKALVN